MKSLQNHAATQFFNFTYRVFTQKVTKSKFLRWARQCWEHKSKVCSVASIEKIQSNHKFRNEIYVVGRKFETWRALTTAINSIRFGILLIQRVVSRQNSESKVCSVASIEKIQSNHKFRNEIYVVGRKFETWRALTTAINSIRFGILLIQRVVSRKQHSTLIAAFNTLTQFSHRRTQFVRLTAILLNSRTVKQNFARAKSAFNIWFHATISGNNVTKGFGFLRRLSARRNKHNLRFCFNTLKRYNNLINNQNSRKSQAIKLMLRFSAVQRISLAKDLVRLSFRVWVRGVERVINIGIGISFLQRLCTRRSTQHLR